MSQPETVRIFIASDVWQWRTGAELILDRSIRENTTPPFQTRVMRALPRESLANCPEGGWIISNGIQDGAWNVGCEPGDVYPTGGTRNSGAWATPFTGFRWAIPEMCKFEGYAIYQDADMIDVGDLRQLWEMGKMSDKPVYLSDGKACVMVLNCAAFKNIEWWPTIEQQKRGGATMYELRSALEGEGLIDRTMPRTWNFPDAYKEGVKICHFTNARTQPWGAYRHKFGMQQHPNPAAVKLWKHYKKLVGV